MCKTLITICLIITCLTTQLSGQVVRNTITIDSTGSICLTDYADSIATVYRLGYAEGYKVISYYYDTKADKFSYLRAISQESILSLVGASSVPFSLRTFTIHSYQLNRSSKTVSTSGFKKITCSSPVSDFTNFSYINLDTIVLKLDDGKLDYFQTTVLSKSDKRAVLNPMGWIIGYH